MYQVQIMRNNYKFSIMTVYFPFDEAQLLYFTSMSLHVIVFFYKKILSE